MLKSPSATSTGFQLTLNVQVAAGATVFPEHTSSVIEKAGVDVEL